MATTDHAAKLQHKATLRILQRIWDATPDMTTRDRLNFLTEKGAFDVSRLNEILRSKETGIAMDSRDGRDHEDGANSKFVSYGPTNGQRTAFGWRVKVYNCEADVVGWLSDPKTDEHYDFHIPKEAIRPNQRYVTITDCVNGGPKGGKWGAYLKKQVNKEISFSFV
jgi:hypothetical protein